MSDLSEYGEIDPLEIVAQIMEDRQWDWERIASDQIAFVVEGTWRTYSITTAWSPADETLRLICTFELEPPTERLPTLYEAINLFNDLCWGGSFNWWSEQRLMVWRYGLILSGEQLASPEQIGTMISGAVMACERFYPGFACVLHSDYTAEAARNMSIREGYGRA